MIIYDKQAFGLNLILRLNGSAVYRACLPGLLSIFVFVVLRNYWRGGDMGESLGHPYTFGVLIATTSFQIIFRANQGYARYWEAVSAVHHMMSKWMDATMHTACFHMQCSHYNHIKPPSFFDYPELNAMGLTRDREVEDEMETSVRGVSKSINALRDSALRKLQRGDSFNGRRRQYYSASNMGKTGNKDDEKATAKSDSEVHVQFAMNGLEASRLAGDREEASRQLPEMDSPQISFPSRASLAPLMGKSRLDGGYSKLFDDDKATFFHPKLPNDGKGFSSSIGGRSPPLFLQELSHLSSLTVAVALSTLRNDIEGATSPLDVYRPGSPWPETDPDKDDTFVFDWSIRGFLFQIVRLFKNYVGMGRTPEERTKYNAARPLPVLGGVSDAEITFLQTARGPYAKTQLCWYWLSEFITREHLNGMTGNVGPPIVSRIIQFLGDGMIYYNHARKIMFIPFPFPHAQLSAIFILAMIPSVPFMMEQYIDELWLGCLVSFAAVTCLAGLHEVARELENPFRNVPNELPLVTLQAHYNEALTVMYSGFHPDHYWDTSQFVSPKNTPEKKETKSSNSKAEQGGDDILQLKKQLEEQSREMDRLRQLVEANLSNGKND